MNFTTLISYDTAREHSSKLYPPTVRKRNDSASVTKTVLDAYVIVPIIPMKAYVKEKDCANV